MIKPVISLAALTLAMCACGASEEAPPTQAAASIDENAATYTLDFSQPVVRHSVDPPVGALAGAKFVEVVVSRVENPTKLALTFVVEFETASGARTRLGVFSLFPPDNPGSFIVPTQGKVDGPGTILVVMQSPDRKEEGARDATNVQVEISRIALRE